MARYFIGHDTKTGRWDVFGRAAFRPNPGSGSVFCVASGLRSETAAAELCSQYETGAFDSGPDSGA